MLNHNYKLNIQAVLFCDIVPTGYKDSDSIVLYLTCLAKKIIWLERNKVKFENKVVSSKDLLCLFKSCYKI